MIQNDFPIKIGEYNNLINYAKLLRKGEEQLLISRDNKLLISDGRGGIIPLPQRHTDEELDDFIKNNTYLNNKITENRINQISKLGVVASKDSPYIVEIPIDSKDFRLPKVNILKFDNVANSDVVKTISSFSVSEKQDYVFEEGIVEFTETTVRLKHIYEQNLFEQENLDHVKVYNSSIDKTKFESIDDLEVDKTNEDKKIVLTATPKSSLLIQNKDLELANISNIDYFNLSTIEDTVKIFFSLDSGVTWSFYNSQNIIEEITLQDPEYLYTKGMTLSEFNNPGYYDWNIALVNKKIRFAFVITGTVELDELKMQYDLNGDWLEAKDSEYDIIYDSHGNMKVKLYCSGDIKINY